MSQGSVVAMSCGVGCRCSLDPVSPWLWLRPAATVLIQPLAWEPPYDGPKKQKKKKKDEVGVLWWPIRLRPSGITAVAWVTTVVCV